MSLIRCHECDREISDSAEVCPHCGYRLIYKLKNQSQRKKKGTQIWWILGGIALIFFLLPIGEQSSTSIKRSDDRFFNLGALNVSVENIRISKDHTNAWGVKGLIRNNMSKSIKGAVKIKFINSNGDIVHTNRANVNDGDYFKPGQGASFEYYVEPYLFNDVVDFDIEFYER